MAGFGVKRPIRRIPTHPGELMREILDDHIHIGLGEAADRMRIEAAALSAILQGRAPVTADIALRFGRLTGGAPELYLQMQAQYDLWTARQTLQDTLAAIEPAA
jgi:antitoxin HigA-1